MVLRPIKACSKKIANYEYSELFTFRMVIKEDTDYFNLVLLSLVISEFKAFFYSILTFLLCFF